MIELQDLQHSYGGTWQNNLFERLFKIALPCMTGYQSDLGHDAVMLSRANANEIYMWGWREMGTHMTRAFVPGEGVTDRAVRTIQARDLIKMDIVHPFHWHAVWVTKTHGNGVTCEGHVWPLLDITREPARFASMSTVEARAELVKLFNLTICMAAELEKLTA